MNDKQQPEQEEELFLEERPIVLSPEDQRVFFEALMSPPKPKEALIKLMRGTGVEPPPTKADEPVHLQE